ncbi:DNA polymerase III subunit gamma/tau [Tunicatimonas pelagia]|uniref:DNA polymerase III subunit gamma/tau n=1 Tax=Tunicatimonas pelagia TaxID=931531 RepID=UPI002664FA27|nr:DNA polymerase III subunit gamma/tau [Tunicatimonas pelagia]WKN45847.1 DNA polymerase III subunit gamma/tau [Tunicatimonas pelagia]
MEKFVVSARKYRPTGFEQVVGQEHITTTLQNAIDQNHLAQALLFCGPRGVGKTTCARIVARKINGFDEESSTNALNIYELDAASNNSVEDIRNLIDQVRYPPQQGKFKVYIIDEVHMLSNQAFNAFLKTLEEPPPYAIFILATTEKHKVIPTILSRCQIYDFNRIQIDSMMRHLQKIAEREGIEAEEEALNLIAQKADGALRDALSIFDLIVTFSADRRVTYRETIQNLHVLDYDYYFQIVDLLLEQKLPQVLLILDDILRQGFDGHNFIVGLNEHLRNVLVCKDSATLPLLQVSDTVQNRYQQQAEQAPLSFLLTAMNLAGQCDLQYKNSKNQRLHVELSLIKMAYIESAVQLAQQKPAPAGDKKKAATPQSDASEVSTSNDQSSDQPPTSGGRGATPMSLGAAPRLQSTIRIPKLGQAPPQPSSNGNGHATKAAEVAELDNTVDTAVLEEKTDQPVSLTKLEEVWKEFIEERRAEGKEIEYVLLNQPINLEGDGVTIPLTFISPIQEDQFDGVRAELLQRLRRRLGNSQINVKTKVVKEERDRRPYTPSEKLNYLSEKHPLLRELTQRMGLDPDY